MAGPTESRPQKGAQQAAQAYSWADPLEDMVIFTHGFDEFMRSPGPAETVECHVTLVHGTFVPEAEWIGPDSPLAGQLEVEAKRCGLAVTVHPFRWSGGLSFKARRSDAIRLHDHLVELVNRFPDAQHCVVAHSHGGSILMQALAPDLGLQRAIRRVICLSTPFLRIARRSEVVESLMLFGLRALILLALFLALLQIRRWPPIAVFVQAKIDAFPPAATTFVAFALAIGVAAAAAAALTLIGKAFERWRKFSDHAFGMSGLPQLRRDQALLVRTAADEAGFVLGLGATLAWGLERLAHLLVAVLLAPLLYLLFVVVGPLENSGRILHLGAGAFLTWMAVMLASAVALLLPVKALETAAFYFLLISLVVFVPGFIALVLGSAAGLINSSFGIEIALCAPFVTGTAETTPLGYWQVFQLPALRDLPLRNIQHSFAYSATDVRTALAIWLLTGQFTSRSDWRDGVPFSAATT